MVVSQPSPPPVSPLRYTSTIVALWLSPDQAEMVQAALPLFAGQVVPPTDYHITLAVTVEDLAQAAPSQVQLLTDSLSVLARTYAPPLGTLGGVGRFTGETSDPIYLSADVPGLAELRQEVVEAIEAAGFTLDTTHGFTPHLTLTYVEPSAPTPVERLETPPLLTFDTLTLAIAGARTDFPLCGTALCKRVSGDMTLPLAPRDTVWTADLTGEWFGQPWPDVVRSSFWVNPEAGDAALFFAAPIEGVLRAVPERIAAIARSIDDGSVTVPSEDVPALKGRIAHYYRRMRKEFGDPDLRAPWEGQIIKETFTSADLASGGRLATGQARLDPLHFLREIVKRLEQPGVEPQTVVEAIVAYEQQVEPEETTEEAVAVERERRAPRWASERASRLYHKGLLDLAGYAVEPLARDEVGLLCKVSDGTGYGYVLLPRVQAGDDLGKLVAVVQPGNGRVWYDRHLLRGEEWSPEAVTGWDVGAWDQAVKGWHKGLRRASLAKSTEDHYDILTRSDERRYTLGVAYPANQTDAHGDFMRPDELERTAWTFLRQGRLGVKLGVGHQPGTEGSGQVVESYIYRGPDWQVGEQTVRAGDWLVGAIWNPDVWAMIKSGELTGFSFQGRGKRRPAPEAVVTEER